MPASAWGILPEEQQLLHRQDCSCLLEFCDKGTGWKGGAAPESCALCLPVAVRSSPSTQLRTPRTSPCLPQPNPHHPQGQNQRNLPQRTSDLLQGHVQALCSQPRAPSTLHSSILEYLTAPGSKCDSPGQHRALHPLTAGPW